MPLIFGSVSLVSCEFVMLDGDVKSVHHSTFCCHVHHVNLCDSLHGVDVSKIFASYIKLPKALVYFEC